MLGRLQPKQEQKYTESALVMLYFLFELYSVIICKPYFTYYEEKQYKNTYKTLFDQNSYNNLYILFWYR